ncbi:ribosomal-protein-alanine N-acetyltransferase [Marininema mesophilum]|uniref:Ribosomal-protein-alanine N-acetyltransferase n=1 Tax=Marininema mesophilum TaxID=1048340 RepID=A0A1H3CKD7_9BACL|nr:ribosomal protein S18-alanine N-acetyltransferase [Marininema mesophilum]SDX54054.1 ribosomal-protein-alanine N-acetyltransferase [Marininema mesophilum]
MGLPPIEFRLMNVADIPAVLQVEQASFTAPWNRQAFYNELVHNQFAHYLVVEHEKHVIGYCGLWLILDEAHITNIAIHPDYRGRGVGDVTMDYLKAFASEAGAKKMTLEVRVSNVSAQRLYRKKGFAATGVRPGYYTDNLEDALIMWAELDGGSDEQNSEISGAGY